MAVKLITPKFRGSYVTLITPRAVSDDAEPSYGLSAVFKKNSKATKAFIAQLEETFSELLLEKIGKAHPLEKCKHYPILDGDEIDGSPEEFANSWVLRLKSKTQPGILVRDEEGNKAPFESASDIYSGAWYHASITPYAWNNKFGKGVSIGLAGVLKIADDEPFSAGAFTQSDFDDL